uniref:Dehydrogenase n=1 Tax=Roseihalotalea indica TaxID=2867963 RepID=A0AA49GLZ4_9BACT|nr:dehydrogenase [Tunicatimonas sp. TK19036]
MAVCGLMFFSCSEKEHYPDALTPEGALQSFQLHDGFDIEIFAAEPQVMDPVSMVFDEQGNAFVVEMPDYPYKPEEGKGQGRIKVLIDTDQDGRVDQATVFADKISEATSVLPWKGGLLVAAAPNILYLKDTNNDFKADSQEILFTGFFENNSEAQITNLRFAVDNWIYASNHGQAGEVSFSRKPGAPKLSMQGGDFRFRLDRDTFALATGPTQFGQAIDDWGHRFMTQNTLHIRHAVIPQQYLDRNPYLPASTAVFNISDHDLEMFQQTPPPYWRAERTRRRQKQYDEQGLDRVEYAEDHFTGASGGTFYAGDAFPEEYYGNIFTGDVAGNLIHRDVLTPVEGSPTFVASRHPSETDKEFLSSTDPWFRPANFTVGPDGYLYVIDMYRQHIETPVSIPEDLKEDMDFMNGMDRGRIYRIKPSQSESASPEKPNLSAMESQELVALLAHPNQWWRLQAQRLLLERQDQSVVPLVESMFQEHKDPRARLHALYVLEGLGALKAEYIMPAMMDAHSGVREHGVLLAERISDKLPQLIQCIQDSSAQVAFQAVLSVGQYDDEAVVTSLADVVMAKGDDPWFKTAVLSSRAGSSYELLKALLAKPSFLQDEAPWKISMVEDVSYAIGARYQQEEIMAQLGLLEEFEESWQTAGVSGLLKGLKKNEAPALQEAIETIEADATTNPKARIAKLREFFSTTT